MVVSRAGEFVSAELGAGILSHALIMKHWGGPWP